MKSREGDLDQPQSQPINLAFWIRVGIGLIVLAAVAYTAIKAFGQLRENRFDFSEVNYLWWAAALGAYVATMLFSCFFWHRVLIAMGQHPKFSSSLLAFFASQLGKYIPGKAMVVIIRTDLIRGKDVKTAPAAASVFVETLTWIFVGSAIASLLLMLLFRDQVVLQVIAGVLAIGAGVLTWPSVFQGVASMIGAARGSTGKKILAGLDLTTMSFGWGLLTMGWCLNGFSLWLVLKGMPSTGIEVGDFPLTLVCVSLATVAGFVSLLPGGIGVRELVMIPLLGERFGPVTAIISAIVIRMVWMAAELLTSGIIYLKRRLS